MPTVINNPGSVEDSGSNLILAIVLMVVILGGIVLFFMYGLPMIQNYQSPSSTNINVTLPAATVPPVVPPTPTK
jgi:hypothetical protein